MKIKTSELIDDSLNWAVAVCEGYTNLRVGVFSNVLIMDPPRVSYGAVEFSDLSFSADLAQGGPIIEREYITWSMNMEPEHGNTTRYLAFSYRYGSDKSVNGPTPLIAAMRCYVASVLGDEVEIPEELT